MGINWGEALASGVAAGANAIGSQYMQQQNDARWLEKQKQLLAMQEQQKREQERYLMALNPAKTDKISVTGEDGRPMVQNREWIPPSDEDIAAGRKGQWNVTSTAPDVSFERLEETIRNNRERNDLMADRLRAQGDATTARLDLARERLDIARERATSGGGGQGKLIRRVDDNGMAVYGTVMDGKFTPVMDEDGNPVTSRAWRERGNFSATGTRQLPTGQVIKRGEADEIGPSYPKSPFGERPELDPAEVASGPGAMGSPIVVDPSSDRPMAQFEAPKPKPAAKPAAKPGNKTSPHGRIVRTGTKDGKRVAQYEDGTVLPL